MQNRSRLDFAGLGEKKEPSTPPPNGSFLFLFWPYDWSYYQKRYISEAIVDMNRQLNPHPSEKVIGNFLPVNADALHPWSPLKMRGKTAVMPLLLYTRTTPTSVDYIHLPRLVITVHLDPVRVHQKWLLDVSADPRIKASANLSSSSEGAVSSEAANTYDSVQYHLPRTTLNDFTDANGLPRIPTGSPDDLNESLGFAQLTHLLIPCIEYPALFSSTFMNHFVMLFCSHVAHLCGSRRKDEAVHRGGLSTWQRRRAMELLSKGTYDDVRLAVIAKECRLSVSHFARSFKTTFGLPVHRWVIDQRVDRAKQLLLNSNESLVEIAFQSGFCDQASFNRTFAKLTGTSPGRWRREVRA